MAVLTDLWAKIKLFFTNTGTVLWPFICQFMTEEGQFILTMVPGVMAEIQASMGDADGPTKRQEAFTKVLAALEAQGLTIAAHVIYGAIEAIMAQWAAPAEVVSEAKMLRTVMDHPPIQVVQP